MTKYAIKNQLKHAETQGNKEQIAPGEEGSRKMTMQSKKQIENQAQEGRSMVEMLGVLAIIAVLSIGGIVGFRLAMNYYQANQIAHEINIMRTDAQIKIAQGTEKLMLGEPYDPISESQLGHIQFNDAYPVDFACALADEDTIELSNISCHVANAYYIELQNIPEGVCRPLAELVNGMNNIIAFNVNKNEYPGEGKCEAGNGNVLNAVFSAEAVSELKVCTGDTDCESENALYCDPSRHVCVRCYEDNQCAHNQYCENNTCVTCESGVWNGEECVECTDNDDCADKTDTPVCYTDTNTCVECLTYSDCKNEEKPQCDEASHTCKSCFDIDPEKPVWADTQCVQCVNSTDCETTLVCKENTCSPCETEEECKEKGTNYHCSKDSTCIQCPDNQVWGGKDKGCVECLSSADCKNSNKPQCNTETNTCVECVESTNCSAELVCRENTCSPCQTEEECQAKGTNYHCSKEDKCIQCDTNEVWDDENRECVECLSSADCKNPEKPLCDTTTNTCIECETNAQCVEKGKDPHCHKATHTCEPCPDESRNDTVRKACVIHIQTIPAYWTMVERDGVKRCQKLTPNHFGPYTHSYELWIHGSFDDYIRFYVNEELPHISSTEATLNEPDNNCNSISYRGEIHCAGSGCSGHISDSRLGTLNVGEFGHLTVYDITHWIAWGGMANTIRDDAAAWLVLGDE